MTYPGTSHDLVPVDSGAQRTLRVDPNATEPRLSLWQRAKRKIGRTPFEERLRIVAAQARLDVFADDDGILEVELTIFNNSRRRLTVDRFHCEQWLWNGVVMPGAEPHFRGVGRHVAKRSHASCWLTFQVGSATIRRVREATRPAPNRYSSVEATLEILGRLWFARRREPLWLHLTPPNVHVRTNWE